MRFLYGLRGGWVVKYTIKESRVMWGGLEAHLEQNPFEYIIPMMGGSMEAMKHFIEEPLFIFLNSQVANRRLHHIDRI